MNFWAFIALILIAFCFIQPGTDAGCFNPVKNKNSKIKLNFYQFKKVGDLKRQDERHPSRRILEK